MIFVITRNINEQLLYHRITHCTDEQLLYAWNLFDQIIVEIDVIPRNVIWFGYNTESSSSHRL